MTSLVMLLSAAWAQQALTFEATRAVEHGKDPAVVTFHPAETGRVEAEITCDGQVFRLARSVVGGQPAQLPLTGLAQGDHACAGDLKMQTTDGTVIEGAIQFRVASLGTLGLTSSLEAYDRPGQQLVEQADRPLGEAMISVYGAHGALLAEAQADLADPLRPRFRWDAKGQVVVRMVVLAQDELGFRTELELLPWEYRVPHEDVVFPTNGSDVAEAEVGKLEQTWSAIAEAIGLYGDVIPITLYIGGYTDTVGDPASNQALSERRARSIAAWYRKRGFTGPIFYQGFGEAALAVPTGDNVDQQANRRAVYLLTVTTPSASADFPRAAWKRL